MNIRLNSEQQQQAAQPGTMRQLIAFVGGIDLCDGRYDTPEHSLFKTLDTTHEPPDFCEACCMR